MSRRLILRPDAETDLAEIVRWYEEKQAGLGWQFAEEAGRALKRASSNPRAYRLMRRQPQVRRILVHRFPYRIFYVLRDDALVVLAVLHGKRKEATWIDRV